DGGQPLLLLELLVSLGQVAAMTAELDEERLAASRDGRALEMLEVRVTLDAVGLHLRPAEERPLLAQMHLVQMAVGVVVVAVRRLLAVHRGAVAVVAGRAAELVGVVLAEEELPLRVRLPRVRLVLEAGLVDP